MRKLFSITKLPVVLVIVALVVAGTAFFVVTDPANIISPETRKPADSSSSTGTINYDPPTEEEKRSGNDKKQEIVKESEQSQQNPTTNTITVVVVDAAQYDNEVEVRAFAANIVKDGICIIKFTKDSHVVEKQVPAQADATTTPCMNLTLPRSDFPVAGSWKVTVTYSSGDKQGKAEANLEIK